MDHPIVIAGDIGKSVERTVYQALWTGLSILVIGFWVRIQFESGAIGLAMDGATIASFLIGTTIATFGRDSGRGDWLQFDGQGLTLVQRGKSRKWRWADISAIERRGLFSATAPKYGRALALRVAHDGRGTGMVRPETAIIGNDYLTPISEIAETLTALRGGAASSAGRADSNRENRADRPDVFLERKDSNGSATRRNARRGIVLAWVSVYCGAVVGTILNSVGWLSDWVDLVHVLTEYETIRYVAGIAAMIGLLLAQYAVVPSGFLLLSSDGLHLRSGGERRHWRWRDLSSFELRSSDPDAIDVTRREAVLAFLAKSDELTMAADPEDVTIAFAIKDIYDTSLAEIARRIETWPHLAREAELEAAGSGGKEPAPSAVEIRGTNQGEMGIVAPIGLAALVAVLLAAFALLALVPFVIGQFGGIPDWIKIMLLLLGVVFVFLFFFVGIAPFVPSEYVLRFEADTFALRRFGLWRRWKWHEMSVCEVKTARLRWRRKRTPLAVFTVPRDDWISRLWLWCYRLDAGCPSVPIEPMYETPLELIVERFADCRDKALSQSRA